MRHDIWLRRSLFLALMLAASACSYVPEEKPLEQRLESLEWSTDRVALRDLTAFSWDTVFVFLPYESGDDVNRAVGGRVMPGGRRVDEFEDLLVFVADGKPVRQATVEDMLALGTRTEWPANVELVAGPGCRIALVLPDDPDPPASCPSSASRGRGDGVIRSRSRPPSVPSLPNGCAGSEVTAEE